MLDFSRSVSRAESPDTRKAECWYQWDSHGEFRKGGRDVEEEFEYVEALKIAGRFFDLFLWWVDVDVSPESIPQF